MLTAEVKPGGIRGRSCRDHGMSGMRQTRTQSDSTYDDCLPPQSGTGLESVHREPVGVPDYIEICTFSDGLLTGLIQDGRRPDRRRSL